MRNKWNQLFCIVLLGIFLSACREEQLSNSSNLKESEIETFTENINCELTNDIPNDAQTDKKVTMDYVCSEFGMSESDFDGIDFEIFV